MFSILLCTLNRPVLIKNCIHSLLNQSYKNFEIIVVDQSADKETEESCFSFGDSRIKYHHVEFTGLSRARNYGLKYCNGSYVCLGDDDAEYDSEYFRRAKDFLQGHRLCILCGRLSYLEPYGRDVYDYHRLKSGQRLKTNDMMRIGSSATLLLPTKYLKKIHGFDEEFGVGAKYGSGEESDVILMLFRRGIKAYFIPEMIIYHGSYEKEQHPDIEKVYKYYSGLGALLKKHLVYYRDFSLIPKFARATLGAYIKYVFGDIAQKEIYKQRITGFWKGFLTYKNHESR